jgi:hypothetical protein
VHPGESAPLKSPGDGERLRFAVPQARLVAAKKMPYAAFIVAMLISYKIFCGMQAKFAERQGLTDE